MHKNKVLSQIYSFLGTSVTRWSRGCAITWTMVLLMSTLGYGQGLLGSAAFAFADEPTVASEPKDHGGALENPGMGWFFPHYDNSIKGYGPPLGAGFDGSKFPGLTVVYLRLAWSHLEPNEGEYAWSLLDTPIQRYGEAGKGYAFRFTVFEASNDQGTPDWVREAGAKGHLVDLYGRQTWEPDYDDPIFLEKLERFLNAVGERYGDDPGLAYVDVGTLGIWGEGHPIGADYGLSTLEKHIDLHQAAFPDAVIAGMDDWFMWFKQEGQPKYAAIDLMERKGLTLRDDTLCVYRDPKRHYNAELAEPFWRDRPVILEKGHYARSKQDGAWGDGERYLKAVEDYHASYLALHAHPANFLKENRALVERINRRLGYRLNLVEARWPERMTRGQPLRIESRWRNAGVAPCLPGGHVAWWLLDEAGNVAAVLVDQQWCVSSLETGGPDEGGPVESHDRSFVLPPHLKPGRYTVCVSVGSSTGRPTIALPHEAHQSLDRRYVLGELSLE